MNLQACGHSGSQIVVCAGRKVKAGGFAFARATALQIRGGRM